jgi:hypothetical protein
MCDKRESSFHGEQEACTRLHATPTSLEAVETERSINCSTLGWILVVFGVPKALEQARWVGPKCKGLKP